MRVAGGGDRRTGPPNGDIDGGFPVLTTLVGRFEPYAVVEDSIDKLLLGLQGQLGNLEVEVAAWNDPKVRS